MQTTFLRYLAIKYLVLSKEHEVPHLAKDKKINFSFIKDHLAVKLPAVTSATHQVTAFSYKQWAHIEGLISIQIQPTNEIHSPWRCTIKSMGMTWMAVTLPKSVSQSWLQGCLDERETNASNTVWLSNKRRRSPLMKTANLSESFLPPPLSSHRRKITKLLIDG